MEIRKENTFQSKAGCALRRSLSVLEHWTGPSSAERRVYFCLIDDPKEGSVWALMSWVHGKPQKDDSLLFLQDIAHYSFLNFFLCRVGECTLVQAKVGTTSIHLICTTEKPVPETAGVNKCSQSVLAFKGYHKICCCWAWCYLRVHVHLGFRELFCGKGNISWSCWYGACRKSQAIKAPTLCIRLRIYRGKRKG